MRFRCLCALFSVLFLLFSGCNRMQNMTELLAYEKEEGCFSLHVKDEKEFDVSFTLGEEADVLTFSEDALQGIGIAFYHDGRVEISYENYKTALPSTALLKALRWKELFHLSQRELIWKIEKETLGGATVYACRAGDVEIYIDSATRLPLKLKQGNLEIDVLSVEKK